MLEDLQIRHYSETTIRLYLHAVSVFAQHFGKPPDQLEAEHIGRYQLFLVQEMAGTVPLVRAIQIALQRLRRTHSRRTASKRGAKQSTASFFDARGRHR
jgi:hypothetical protein